MTAVPILPTDVGIHRTSGMSAAGAAGIAGAVFGWLYNLLARLRPDAAA